MAETASGGRRRFGRIALLAHLALAFALVPRWYAVRNARARAGLERRFFDRVLRAVGVTVVLRGTPSRTAGTLFLANHLSFTDVVALAVALDCDFVAKAELARWPILGPLAKGFGTVFVARDRAMDAPAQIDAVARRLREGRSVMLFPEGTTSDGAGVLPFRSALLAAGAAASVVQPVALRYTDGARRAYIGDESLLANLLRLAPCRSVLTIDFLPPLGPGDRVDRKTAARAAHLAITLALGASPAGGGSSGIPGSPRS